MNKSLFVSDVRECWRWFSMWAMGLPASAAAAWLAIPTPWQNAITSYFTTKQLAWAALIIMGAGMLGRVVNQAPPNPNP